MRQEFDNASDGVFQGQHCMVFYTDAPELQNFTSQIADLILPQNAHIELMRQYMNFHKDEGKVENVGSEQHENLERLRPRDLLNTINILEMRTIDMLAA